jgi:hypothetical protein
MGSKYATISEYTTEMQIFTAQHLTGRDGQSLPAIGGQPDRPLAANVADGVCRLSPGDDLGTF